MQGHCLIITTPAEWGSDKIDNENESNRLQSGYLLYKPVLINNLNMFICSPVKVQTTKTLKLTEKIGSLSLVCYSIRLN